LPYRKKLLRAQPRGDFQRRKRSRDREIRHQPNSGRGVDRNPGIGAGGGRRGDQRSIADQRCDGCRPRRAENAQIDRIESGRRSRRDQRG